MHILYSKEIFDEIIKKILLKLALCSLLFSDSGEKKVLAMPGSPVDVKTHSRPSAMPPLPSVNPSGPRPAAFSSTACMFSTQMYNYNSHVSTLLSETSFLENGSFINPV